MINYIENKTDKIIEKYYVRGQKFGTDIEYVDIAECCTIEEAKKVIKHEGYPYRRYRICKMQTLWDGECREMN